MPGDRVALLIDGTPSPHLRFPAGHYHTLEEVHGEVARGGDSTFMTLSEEKGQRVLLEIISNASTELISTRL